MHMDYRKVLSFATVFALAAAGSARATEEGRSAAKDRESDVHRLSCANGGTPRKVPIGPHDASLGPLRFVNGRFGAGYPPRHFRPTSGRELFPLKAPMLVDPGARLRIEIARADRRHVWLGYGAGRTDRLDVVACRHTKPTVWLGAIVVDGARCARLRVVQGGSTSILRIPFGRGTCRRA